MFFGLVFFLVRENDVSVTNFYSFFLVIFTFFFIHHHHHQYIEQPHRKERREQKMQRIKRTPLNRLAGFFRTSIGKNNLLAFGSESFSTSTSAQIVLPKAIKRGPTDILEALAATVKMDYTGPLYRYLDDPYLTPNNSFEKRSYSLSKEAGRKAANYFFDKYPQYFYRDISEPKIEAFTFKEAFDDDMQFEELDLAACIAKRDVSNAIICYRNLMKQSTPISDDIRLDLLDLVSFHNGEDAPERFPEEDWFQRNYSSANRLEPIKVWRDNDFAEQLFDSLPAKSGRAYCALIRGMCRFQQTDRAFAYYRQAIDQGLRIDSSTFTALIRSSYGLRATNEERWKTILDLLRAMHTNSIKPDLHTLNAVLQQISRYRFWNQNAELAKRTFNEFAFRFGIEPSLATYYHLLNVFHRSKTSRSTLIYEIVERLSGAKFELHDADDVNFFATAMDVCYNLNDHQLAYRVHQMAEQNAKFIGKGANQSNYYNRLIKLLCSTETVENFMIVYAKFVPNIYTPNHELMDQILRMLKIYKSLDHLPHMWNDLVLFAYVGQLELVQNLLAAMDDVKRGDAAHLDTFCNIVSDIYQRINQKIQHDLERGFTQNQIQWTAKSLSCCISILSKADNVDSAYEIFTKLDALKYELIDQPEAQTLLEFCRSAVSADRAEIVQHFCQYCREMERSDVLAAIGKEYENAQLPNEQISNLLKNLEI